MINKSKLLKLKKKVTPDMKVKVSQETKKSIIWIQEVLNGKQPDNYRIIPRLIELVKLKSVDDQKRAKLIEKQIDELS